MKKFWILIGFFFLILGLSGCGSSDLNVKISLPSGTYYGEQHVTLECADPSAQITYSLDGSDPYKSNLVYNPETGISIGYTSTLKATAGGDIAEAHYDILEYSEQRDPVQQEFYDKVKGTYSMNAQADDNFIIKNSTIHIQTPGQPEIISKYMFKDVNGNNATILYTDAQGVNQSMPISVNPEAHTLTFNGKTYTDIWYLRDESEETEYDEDSY